MAVERAALEPYGIGPAAFRLAAGRAARAGRLAPSVAASRLGVRQPTVSGWIAELRARVCSSGSATTPTGAGRACA